MEILDLLFQDKLLIILSIFSTTTIMTNIQVNILQKNSNFFYLFIHILFILIDTFFIKKKFYLI